MQERHQSRLYYNNIICWSSYPNEHTKELWLKTNCDKDGGFRVIILMIETPLNITIQFRIDNYNYIIFSLDTIGTLLIKVMLITV